MSLLPMVSGIRGIFDVTRIRHMVTLDVPRDSELAYAPLAPKLFDYYYFVYYFGLGIHIFTRNFSLGEFFNHVFLNVLKTLKIRLTSCLL